MFVKYALKELFSNLLPSLGQGLIDPADVWHIFWFKLRYGNPPLPRMPDQAEIVRWYAGEEGPTECGYGEGDCTGCTIDWCPEWDEGLLVPGEGSDMSPEDIRPPLQWDKYGSTNVKYEEWIGGN